MKIITYPNPLLNQRSKTCEKEDLPAILEAYTKMCTAMKESKGIGLAAIQVGIPKTFCIVISKSTELGGPNWETPPELIINPELIEISKETKKEHEGCLSLPLFWEKIERPLEVVIQYRDKDWELRTAVFYDILAKCIMHECLPASTIVTTNVGNLSIKKIVNEQIKCKVLSLNIETQKTEWKSILNYNSKFNISKKKWINLKFSNTGPNKQLICTEDHLIATVKTPLNLDIKFIEAKDSLNTYLIRQIRLDKIRNKEHGLYNSQQISCIIGCLLGDGCISSAGELIHNHSNKQRKYIEYKQQILGGTISKSYSGYLNSYTNLTLRNSVTEQLKYLRTICYFPKKSIKNIINLIDEISLAFWYMDDGSLVKSAGRQKTEYPILHTYGFSLEDILLLQLYLKKQFNLDFSIQKRIVNNKLCYFLRLKSKYSCNFFETICPYVCKSMMYKIPNKYHYLCDSKSLNSKPLDISLKLINDIQIRDKLESKLYNIEVEDNHNYFANYSLVHNCDHMRGEPIHNRVSGMVKQMWEKKLHKKGII